jgi:multidrug resistance efflux pump
VHLPAFHESIPALDADRPPLATLLAALALVALWLTWALAATVPVLAESTSATIETPRPPVVLTAPADGLVVRSDLLAPGQLVTSGQPLLQLDTADLETRGVGLRTRRTSLDDQARSLEAQRAAARHALDEEQRAATAAAGELAAAARQAASLSSYADRASDRGRRLAAAGVLAAADAARAQADAEQRRQAANAASLARTAAAHQAGAARADRRAGLAVLDADAARLREQMASLDLDAATLAAAFERRTLRALIAGRLADLADLDALAALDARTGATPGSRLARGARLGLVVPAGGPLRILAVFPPATAAALRPGQAAWAHLAAGPTAPAAVLRATVAAVAPLPGAGGSYEVALALPAEAPARSPLVRAGQRCRVEVELARRTPATLLLAAIRQGAAAAP